MFDPAAFEALGRRIAAAPRAVAAALLALCGIASPGVVRLDLAAPPRAEGADSMLLELACDAGVWSSSCVAQVDSLSRELLARGDLVESVDSLSTRPRVVFAGGALALAPLVAAQPVGELELRRLRARADAEPAAVRGLVAPNERAALLQVRLRAGASARELHALVRALRLRFDRPPEFALGVASEAVAADALELRARRGARRAAPAVLAGLALLAGLACRSLRVGLALAALTALACFAGAGLFSLAKLPLGAAAAALPALAGAAAAGTGFALLHRAQAEERAGVERSEALARALGAVGPGASAAGLAGAAGFLALAWASGAARGLALASALLLLAAAAVALVGLPALLLGTTGSRSPLRASVLGIASEGALAQLDLASRARGPRRMFRWLVLCAAALAAGSGVRALRADASDAALLNGTRELDDAARLARDFGGAALVRVELDSGAAGGALEPQFLERALEFERASAREAGVGSARSLVDAALMPAMRAQHGDDPVFEVVPPTRAAVEDALAPFARAAPERLALGIDTERRRLAVELLADLRAPEDAPQLALALDQHALASFGRPGVLLLPRALSGSAQAAQRLRSGALWAAVVAIAAVAAVAALAFESPLAGLLGCVPSVFAALAVLGLLGELRIALDPSGSVLPVLAAAASAAPALLYLGRVRELCSAGADLDVAVSIGLRDAGRPVFEGAVASLGCLALLAVCAPHLGAWSALACTGSAVGTAGVLGLVPAWLRALRPRFVRSATASHGRETHSGVRRARGERDGDAGHG